MKTSKVKTPALFILISISLILLGSCKKDNSESPKVTDGNGNIYHTVTIGTQVWMVENLKTTKYNDGTAIPNVTNGSNWINLTTPAYCWYNNDSTTNNATYGILYNWYAINSGKLCPAGWHVPSDAEWTILENYLIAHGYNYDGSTTGDRDTNNKIAKSLAATTNWTTNILTGVIGNTDYPEKRNASGFTALPGGNRTATDGKFYYINNSGNWWSTTEYNSTNVYYRYMFYFDILVERAFVNKSSGLSVRCIKD